MRRPPSRPARRLLRLTLAAAAAMPMAPAPLPAQEVTAQDTELLAVDRDFALRADDAGIRAAYERFLADDAVLFRPLPVRGSDWLATHEPATGRLEWTPTTALVACDASLGLTFGTWSYTAKDSKVADTGQYLTAWRRGDAGDWRIVLDQSLPTTASPPAGAAAGARPCAEAADAAKRLAATERKLNKGLRNLHAGAAAALPVHAVTTGTLLGSGRADIAVTHGELLEQGAPAGDEARTRAVYVRVWRRDGRAWHVLHDYLTPVAPQASL
jgi:ketosteroid isomerase-like protein